MTVVAVVFPCYRCGGCCPLLSALPSNSLICNEILNAARHRRFGDYASGAEPLRTTNYMRPVGSGPHLGRKLVSQHKNRPHDSVSIHAFKRQMDWRGVEALDISRLPTGLLDQ
jgi:hypothetical protein